MLKGRGILFYAEIVLLICFVEGENVAVNKTATQSSTFGGFDPYQSVAFNGSASLAVDGNRSQDYGVGACTSTDWFVGDCDDGCWWSVNLGRAYIIKSVAIYGRSDKLITNVMLRCRYETVDSNLTVGPQVINISVPDVISDTVNISYTKPRDGLSLCEVEVYATTVCQSNPCQHVSACQESDTGYKCLCADGYNGTNCEEDVNECVSSPPCRNGTCENTVGSYNCTCYPGYEGKDCSQDINECLRSPCQNGGICRNYIGSYDCFCANGYHKKTCELDPYASDATQLNYNPCNDVGVGAGIGIGIAIAIVVMALIHVIAHYYRRARKGEKRPADLNLHSLPQTTPNRPKAASTGNTTGHPVSPYETLDDASRIQNVPNDYEKIKHRQQLALQSDGRQQQPDYQNV